MLKIPLQQIPSQKLRIVLAGQNVTLRFFYRFDNLYADVYVGGHPVNLGAVCRNRSAIVLNSENLFSGNLYFVDMIGDSDPTGYDTFNDRYILLYVGKDEAIPAGLMG